MSLSALMSLALISSFAMSLVVISSAAMSLVVNNPSGISSFVVSLVVISFVDFLRLAVALTIVFYHFNAVFRDANMIRI
jgi:hypothetical protein